MAALINPMELLAYGWMRRSFAVQMVLWSKESNEIEIVDWDGNCGLQIWATGEWGKEHTD